jgi:MFS family permease
MTRARLPVFIAARSVSVFGNALGPLALTFAVLGIPGATPAQLSLVLVCLALPRILLMPVGGLIGDRFRRDRILIAAELGGMAAYAAAAALVLTGRETVPWMALCAALTGTAAALLLPSLSGLMVDLIEPDRLQRANAALKLGTNSATVAGFACGGLLIAALGPGWALAADAATYGIAAGLLATLRLPGKVKPPPQQLAHRLREGWHEFVSRRWLWRVVLAAALINAAAGITFGIAGPLLAKQELGGAGAWSAVLAAYAVGMLTGVVLAGRIRTRHPLRVATLAAIGLGLPALALGSGAGLGLAIAGAVLAGIAFDVFGVLWETTVQREVPKEAISRVSAYEWLGAVGFGPVALVAGGLLAQWAGPRRTLLLMATIIFVAALAALLSPAVRTYERTG